MLNLLVRNTHGGLSDTDREYAEKKLGRLDRYLNRAQRAEIAYYHDKRGHKVEVTVFADGMVLRGEERDPYVHAAIDKVADKLENRMRRLKKRLTEHHHARGEDIPLGLAEAPFDELNMEEGIAEFRHYDSRPMSVDDAKLQMELVERPFFVFHNLETGKIEVLYRTNDGYGLVVSKD